MSMRQEYTKEEKLLIVNRIIKEKAYRHLRGNIFWQECEKHIKNRTWQSLKEHFRKKIVTNLQYLNIPSDEVQKIKEGWQNSGKANQERENMVKQDRRGRCFKNDFSDEEGYGIDDSSDSDYKSAPARKRKSRIRSKEESTTKSIKPSTIEQSLNSSPGTSADLLRIGNKETEVPETSEEDDLPSVPVRSPSVSVTPDIIDLSDDYTDDNVTTIIERKTSPSLEITDSVFTSLDDRNLLTYMKNDTFLERKEQEKIYEYFLELYPTANKTPKMVKDRFLNHILPNLYTYGLPLRDMINMYTTAKLAIPEKWKLGSETDSEIRPDQEIIPLESPKPNTDTIHSQTVLSDSDTNSDIDISNPIASRKTTSEILITDTDSNNSEIEKSLVNYVYCVFTLKNQCHIFVSGPDTEKERTIEILSKKFDLPPRYIHLIDFDFFILCEQINKIRNCIANQYSDIIKNSFEAPIPISIKDIVSSVEICVAAFDLNDLEQPRNLQTAQCGQKSFQNVHHSQKSQPIGPTGQRSPLQIVQTTTINSQSDQSGRKSPQTVDRVHISPLNVQKSQPIDQTDQISPQTVEIIKINSQTVQCERKNPQTGDRVHIIPINVQKSQPIDQTDQISPQTVEITKINSQTVQCGRKSPYTVDSVHISLQNIQKSQPIDQTDQISPQPVEITKINSQTAQCGRKSPHTVDSVHISLQNIQKSQPIDQRDQIKKTQTHRIIKISPQTAQCGQKSPQKVDMVEISSENIQHCQKSPTIGEISPKTVQSIKMSPQSDQRIPISAKIVQFSPNTPQFSFPSQTAQSSRTIPHSMKSNQAIQTEHSYSFTKIKTEIKEEPLNEEYLTLDGEKIRQPRESQQVPTMSQQDVFYSQQSHTSHQTRLCESSQYLDSTQTSNSGELRDAVKTMSRSINDSDIEMYCTPLESEQNL